MQASPDETQCLAASLNVAWSAAACSCWCSSAAKTLSIAITRDAPPMATPRTSLRFMELSQHKYQLGLGGQRLRICRPVQASS